MTGSDRPVQRDPAQRDLAQGDLPEGGRPEDADVTRVVRRGDAGTGDTGTGDTGTGDTGNRAGSAPDPAADADLPRTSGDFYPGDSYQDVPAFRGATDSPRDEAPAPEPPATMAPASAGPDARGPVERSGHDIPRHDIASTAGSGWQDRPTARAQDLPGTGRAAEGPAGRSETAVAGEPVTGPNRPVGEWPSTAQQPQDRLVSDQSSRYDDQTTRYNAPTGRGPGDPDRPYSAGSGTGYPPTTVAAPVGYPSGPVPVGQPSQGADYSSPGQYQQGPPGGYQNDQRDYRSGPQVIEPIQQPGATAVVLPPPVKLPKAESRLAINAFGTLIGILLVAGGLILLLRFAPQLRDDTGAVAVLPTIWTAVGALLIAIAALLSAWASWASIVPGVIVAGVSVWAMITPLSTGGAKYADMAGNWVIQPGRLGELSADGIGLMIGLLLLAAGLAAVVIRAGVRRNVRQQLATMQS